MVVVAYFRLFYHLDITEMFQVAHSSSLGLIRVSEQDTISDESGYSEDPIASSGKEVSVVKVSAVQVSAVSVSR